MAVVDTQVHKSGGRVGGGQRGRKMVRWPDRIDQQYIARLTEEGRLTRRDIAIMDWLADVRSATAEQISRVFFSNVGTARNRLSELYKLRIVERGYMPPNDATDLGYSPYLLAYYVGRGGRYWLTQMEQRKFETGWKVQLPQNVAHDLMSTELIAALHEDFRRSGEAGRIRLESEVVFWKLDAVGKPVLKEVKRKGETVKERVALLRSDMRLEAKLGGDDAPTVLSAFIEADRGTMNQTQFAEKVKAYNEAAAQWRNREAAQEGAAQPFPLVLVVTMGSNRAKHLAQTISENAGEGVVWTVIDWERLRGLAAAGGALVAPVWWKAARGRVAADRVLLPSLAKRLGAAANNDTGPG